MLDEEKEDTYTFISLYQDNVHHFRVAIAIADDELLENTTWDRAAASLENLCVDLIKSPSWKFRDAILDSKTTSIREM